MTDDLPELLSAEHEPRVAPSERGLWRGACSCGWRAEVDWPYLGAVGDAYDHVAGTTPFRPAAQPYLDNLEKLNDADE